MNSHVVAQAQALGLGSFVDTILQKYGPYLGQLLLDLLVKKSQHQDLMAVSPHAQSAFDIKGLLVMLLQQFGPSLVNQAADMLAARGDAASTFLAIAVRQAGPELLKAVENLLQSPQGTAAIVQVLQSLPAA